MLLLHFSFFSFIFLFFVIFVIIRYLWITILFNEKIVIVRKRSFSIGLFVAGFCCILPRASISVREKKKHLPRNERPDEGDLVQIDGSLHDWFMNGHKITLLGLSCNKFAGFQQ